VLVFLAVLLLNDKYKRLEKLQMQLDQRPSDNEAAMARADLYKLANYSFKLFKMIKDGDELEGWVQAKVTKAADYIASVYHYMEYEMKFSEYGEKLNNSDVYTESVKREYKRKLTEAQVKLAKLKKENMSNLDEGWEDMMKDVEKKAKEKGTGKFDKKELKPGVTQYTRKSNTFTDGGDDKDTKKAKAKAKGVKESMFGNDEASLAKKSPQLQQLIALRKDPKYQSPEGKAALEARIKKQMDRVSLDKGEVVGPDGKPVAVKEGKKPDFLDMDKDGNKKEPLKKAVADKKKTSVVSELSNNTLKSYSSKAKKDAAEHEKAGHAYDSDPDEKDFAPSAFKKAASRKAGAAKADSKIKEGSKPDFLDMDKDGNKKEPMKKAVADKKKGAAPKKGINPFAKK
jgi:hypothetical protein